MSGDAVFLYRSEDVKELRNCEKYVINLCHHFGGAPLYFAVHCHRLVSHPM